VTGGGTGIGKAIVEQLAGSGVKVLITGRREAPLAELADRHAENVSFLMADVTIPDERDRIILTDLERYGQLDVLINNAGAFWMGNFVDSTDNDFESTYSTIAVTPAALVRAAIPHLI
jgi:NAD(P)-dependent dehydrogenase (short-subunit alcohol dehydrogenase family)